MEIRKSGKWLSERLLIIKASSLEDGHIIDKWHEQIIEHMDKLNITEKTANGK